MIDNLRNYFINGNEIITLVAAIVPIVSFFIGNRINGAIKSRKRRKILSIKSKTCTVTIPEFNATIYPDRISRVLLLEESILQNQIIGLCHEIGINTKTHSKELDIVGDEIHIGGPTSNKFVNSYFHTYFQNYKWLTNKEHYDRYIDFLSEQLHLSVMQVVSNDAKEGILINSNPDLFFEDIRNIQGVAVLIKMTSSDVNIGNKNIHMLFGGELIGTKAAVEYFVKCYEELYKEHKDKHYFLVFPVCKKTGQPLDKPTDLSDIMFLSKKLN